MVFCIVAIAKYYRVRTVILYPCQEIEGRARGPTVGVFFVRLIFAKLTGERNSSFVFTPFKLTGNSPCIYHACCTHVRCRLSVLINRYVTIAPGFCPSHHKGRYQPRQTCSKWDNAHEKPLNSIHIHWTPVFRPLAVAVKPLPNLYRHPSNEIPIHSLVDIILVDRWGL